MNDNNSRRDMLKAAGAGLLIVRPEIAFGSQANSALTVGLLGAGRRGTAISNNFFAKNEFARVAAICDIYQDQLDAASNEFRYAPTSLYAGAGLSGLAIAALVFACGRRRVDEPPPS